MATDKRTGGHWAAQNAEKYLTKLIPSTQRVYLPIFDSILDGNSSKLEMGYYDDESKDKDLISETTRSEREQNQNKNVIDCNFQAKVLTFIFKRTGIVFVDHAAYINDIIPTTMRGLAHLLNFLYHMKKVEDIGDILEAVPQEFIERVENRLTAIKHNLDLFEEYFMNEWVPAKVDGEMVKILKGIQEQVDENIIWYAFNEMYDMYNYDKIMPTGTGRLDGGTYYTLMEMLSGINGSLEENEPAMMYKHKIDYYNTFAVRTLLTIKKNKQAIKLKFEAIRKARENQEGGIDYSPFELRKFIPYRLLNENSAGEYNKRIRPVVKLYAQLLNDENAIVEKKLSQNERFCMHEFSWIVLCNWEVQSVIYKAVVNYSKLEKKKTPGDVWKHILDAISEKNCGMLKPIITGGAVQIDKWPDEFSNTYSTETNKSEKKNNDDNSEHESENINRVNETGITTISQMIVNIQSKLEKDSVGNLSVLKDSLADVNGLLVKKKKELEKVRDEIRKDNPSNEKGEYGELIDVFEKHVIEGESILYLINKGFERSNSDMEQPESETTQPFGEDNALSDDMVKKVNDWLSRIRVDNEKAEWLLTQANKGIHPVD